MKRPVFGIIAVVVVLAAGIWLLRRAPAGSSGPRQPNPGLYENDSLGVGMPLPPSPGWSFRYAPNVPDGGLVMVIHESETASVRLYVHSKKTSNFESVIARRRQKLADLFQVRDLGEVIARVLKEDHAEFKGHPAYQWQGITEPVAVAGKEPHQVMFMLLTVERDKSIFDFVGIVACPMQLAPEQQQVVQALVNDVQLVLANLQIR